MSDDTQRNLPLDPRELETTGVMEEAVRRDQVHDATTKLLGAQQSTAEPPDPARLPGTERVPRVGMRSGLVTLFLAIAAFGAALALTAWFLRR